MNRKTCIYCHAESIAHAVILCPKHAAVDELVRALQAMLADSHAMEYVVPTAALVAREQASQALKAAGSSTP